MSAMKQWKENKQQTKEEGKELTIDQIRPSRDGMKANLRGDTVVHCQWPWRSLVKGLTKPTRKVRLPFISEQ